LAEVQKTYFQEGVKTVTPQDQGKVWSCGGEVRRAKAGRSSDSQHGGRKWVSRRKPQHITSAELSLSERERTGMFKIRKAKKSGSKIGKLNHAKKLKAEQMS